MKFQQRTLVFIITLLGLLLRLFRLGFHDFWYDEIVSIFTAKYYYTFWGSPFFYAILHFWMKLFGQSEFSVRFPAMIFSTLAIPLTYMLGKKLFSSKVGLFAATIMALSPFQLWYAQEARLYSLVLLFSITSTYFLVMYIKGSPKYWFYFILSSVLGIYSGEHYFFLLASHLIFLTAYILFFSNKSELKRVMLTIFFIFICFLPWINHYLGKFNYMKRGFWIPKPDLSSFAITLENLLIGYNLWQGQYYIVSFLVVVLLFAAFRAAHKNRDIRINFNLCLFLFVFSIITIFIFSRLVFSVYIDRSLIIFSPYYYILLAIGINFLTQKRISLIVYCVISILFIVGITSFYQDSMPTPFKHHVGTYIKKPVKPLIRFIEEKADSNDIVGFTNMSTEPAWKFYGNNSLRYYIFFSPALPDTNWNRLINESKYVIPKQKIPSLPAKRIWVIASNWSHDGGLDRQSESIKNYLNKQMRLKLSKNIDGVWVYLYDK